MKAGKEVVLMGIKGDLDEHIHRELEHKLQMYKLITVLLFNSIKKSNRSKLWRI